MRAADDRRLTPGGKKAILVRDGYRCAYCTEEATEVDHIIPWAFIRCDDEENLVAACHLCNAIASAKVFDSFDAKKEAILERREKLLKKRTVAIWTESELSVLGRKMKQAVRDGAIVVEDRKTGLELAERLVALGINVSTRQLD